MNPLQWAQDNIFYTDSKKKEINDAMYSNAPVKKPDSAGNPGVGVGPFVSPRQKEYVNNQMYKNAPPVKPERTQAQKTQEINAAVSDFFGVGKKTSTVVGPGGGNGFGLGSKNTVNTPKSEEVVSPTNNGPNNAAEINKRLDQQKAEKAAALARTKGGYDHSSGSYVGQTSGRQILPAEETVTNAAGVVQTGKNLGGGGTPIDMKRSFNDLLAGVGQTPFGGTQLPTTMGNPYTATYKQTAGFGDEVPDIGGMNGATYDSEGGRNALSATNLQDMAPFNPSASQIEGGSERISQQATGISSGRLSDALAGVQTQEANREMTPERRQLMARAAFMNDGDSMQGLKARDAVNDVVYAGGQHWGRGALTEDSKYGDKYKIDRADARDIASGKQTASGLLDVYKTRLKKESGSTTPVEAQEPPTIEKPGVKQSFGRTTPITPGIDTSIPDTTAFNSNNGVDVPEFGNTGGYKSTSKKPEVDYSSIFSY